MYSYEILDDGYYIKKNGVNFIEQRGIYSKLFIPTGSFEDNAIAQIAELEANDEASAQQVSDLEALRSDVDFLLMLQEEV
jgi:hypothetical protein